MTKPKISVLNSFTSKPVDLEGVASVAFNTGIYRLFANQANIIFDTTSLLNDHYPDLDFVSGPNIVTDIVSDICLHDGPDDDFTGLDNDPPNPCKWSPLFWAPSYGSPPSYGAFISGNKLRTDITGGNVTYGVMSLWQFGAGDIDMEITYNRQSSTTGQSLFGLWFPGISHSYTFGIVGGSHRWFEQDPNQTWGFVGPPPQAVGVDGHLRITKIGNQVKGYYWDFGTSAWVLGYTFNATAPNAPGVVNLFANDGSFSTIIDWDNFKVNSSTGGIIV